MYQYRIIIAFCVLVLFLLVGCAKALTYPERMKDWTRVTEVKGCVTYLPKWREHHDINVQLNPDFESNLMSSLLEKKLETPLCWYETPAQTLVLRAGYYCGAFKEAKFVKVESGWALKSFEEYMTFCDEKIK